MRRRVSSVNALVHRDYSLSAPVRLFVFDNRIEIISPGHLPGNRTLENIRAGISSLRNPILASFVAKGLLPYHGLGTGIRRALAAWPDIEFRDDRDGRFFTAVVHRHTQTACPSPAGQEQVEKRSKKEAFPAYGSSEENSENPSSTAENTSPLIRTHPEPGQSPAKGGHWELLGQDEPEV
ncbi:MAG TPA: hypothetical protein H9894_02685 [Candidatus Desulfovibrio intestinipullorum]|uniref:ATP-dependent DNA helicase RecG C-terminal domain-containing protein n=1 Tax=Candidatus Desulfovibrio intestinipullorum TaxID=2838536 RepID=A0A9D1TNX4_9BACT|nr:hypothetical protein [Candidatus Desulfovibrio intestinipullorum]